MCGGAHAAVALNGRSREPFWCAWPGECAGAFEDRYPENYSDVGKGFLRVKTVTSCYDLISKKRSISNSYAIEICHLLEFVKSLNVLPKEK